MTSRSIRVLVVDDSALFREALANFVAHLKGVVVAGRASGGEEALDLAASTEPDGLSATRALKQRSPRSAVIVCTTYDDERLRQAALEAGADVFMHKRDLALDAEGLIRSLSAQQRLEGRS